MAEWYYTTNQQQMGPVSFDELKQLASKGLLRPTDMVWKDGMGEWARASTQGLFTDDEEDAPPASRKKRSSRRDDDGDDDREEKRPPRRRSARRDDDDDDDDDDDRRPSRRRSRGEGMPVGLKVGLILGGSVLGLVVVGLALFFILRAGGGQTAGMGTFNKVLTLNDPRDPLRGQPSQSHQVTLVANRTYTIEMRSVQLDSYLRLENGQGLQVAWNDDGGGGLDARIVYRAPQSGPHRIICTTFGGGIGAYTLTVREN